MFASGAVMGKRGRPPKPDGAGDGNTKMVRLHGDLAEMIGWIVKLEGGGITAAALLDPLIRGPILARYERIKPQVERIKRAQKEVRDRPEE